MKKLLWAAALIAALIFPFDARAKALSPNVARAQLNLAWDSYEQGRYQEALDYLPQGIGQGPLAKEALGLRYDALLGLSDFEKALVLLASASFLEKEERQGYAEDLAARWVDSALWKEDYAEARRAVELVKKVFQASNEISALREKVLFRSSLVSFVRSKREKELQEYGVEAFVSKEAPTGGGWMRVCPIEAENASLMKDIPQDWMPETAASLSEEGLSLYLRQREGSADKILELLTKANATGYDKNSKEFFFKDHALGEFGVKKLDEVLFGIRALAEGVGPLGAAMEFLEEAQNIFGQRVKLVNWLSRQEPNLKFYIGGQNLTLKDEASGRSASFRFDTVDAFIRDDIDTFGEIARELARPQKPLTCFCGREVVVRRVMERGDGEAKFTKRYAAVCPKHFFPITDEIASQWKMSGEELGGAADKFSASNPLELVFSRPEGKDDLLCFAGYGASSLADDPAGLLKLLESVDGLGYRNSVVLVKAPSALTLMVKKGPQPADFTNEDDLCALGMTRRSGLWDGPGGYAAKISLPERGAGSFSLRMAK